MGQINSFKDLRVWQNAFELGMQIFRITKSFPREEMYSLTDQVRRSSRGVSANISEAWRKRRYPASFVSKLSDAETEAAETQNWILFAQACGYLSEETTVRLEDDCEKIIAQIVLMIDNPDKWTF